MNKNEIVRNGKAYIPEDYAGTDCGRELGKCCAFEGLKCWEFAECAPDKRLDKRNVIFVEKQR